MDEDRKYRQRGYMDTGREPSRSGLDRSRPQGPRPPLDVTGPRLPRLVQSVTAARCFNCATPLPYDVDFHGNCPKCAAALHCCKQCTHFDPSTRFQCHKPILARIAIKDQANECQSFAARVTVARDVVPTSYSPAEYVAPTPTRRPSDARAAFDNLFKK